MKQVVKFDLLGQRRLEFDEESLTYVTNEIYPVPLPGHSGKLHIKAHIESEKVAIPYGDIRWVGVVRRRQRWTLVLGMTGTALGLFWTIGNLGDWGAAGFGIAVLLLLGVWPLYLFAKGRAFIAVADETQAICFPADRKREQVATAISMLREHCAGRDIGWRL